MTFYIERLEEESVQLVFQNNFIVNEKISSTLISEKLLVDSPYVSIVITTYKRSHVLREAIDSALDQQDYNDYEVIVVDNESEVGTATEALLTRYSNENLFYYKNSENLGMVGNWNRGIQLARGKWITILHDDDLLHPQFLQKMIEYTKKEYDMIACETLVGDSLKIKDFLQKECFNQKSIRKLRSIEFIKGNMIPFPGVLFKKTVAMEIGGFPQEYYPISDHAFWAQCSELYCGGCVQLRLAFYRLSELNESKISQTRQKMIAMDIQLRKKFVETFKYNDMIKFFYYHTANRRCITSNKNKLDKRLFLDAIIKSSSSSMCKAIFYGIYCYSLSLLFIRQAIKCLIK